jgi:LacI family transcriptional regulator
MEQSIKYTMRDVARLSGVSISTVSAVINATVPVSPEREQRVRQAMAALDYHPDAVARSLKTGKTNVIGMIVPDITNAFFPEVVRGVEDAARRSGYSVILCDSREDSQEEQRHLSMLFSRRVDGVLIACSVDSTAYDMMIRRRFPIVFVDRVPSEARDRTVSSDNVQAGYTATEYLISLGHDRIALLAGHLGLSPHRDRLEGFRKAMEEYHLAVRHEYLIVGNVQIEDGLAAGQHLLNLSERPTAIMASNTKLLLGLIQALDLRGVSLPSEMSVLSFDDYVWSNYLNPKLTTVAQETYEMGKCSFELLLRIIRGDSQGFDGSIRLPTHLRVRDSTVSPVSIQAPAGQTAQKRSVIESERFERHV